MITDTKNKVNRSKEIVKRSNTKPFADNPIERNFTIIYIIRGTKYIRHNDICRRFSKGDTVCMAIGAFEIENIPDTDGKYEEIAIRYSAVELQNAVTRLHLIHDLAVDDSSNRRGLKRCCGHKTEKIIASLFDDIEHKTGSGMTDEYIENVKNELIYMLITLADSDTINCILDNMDPDAELFVRTIYANIFVIRTLEELARKCNRSLSSLKIEFNRHFNDTPHRWITKQRMKRACFLLRHTDKSVSEIGRECMYDNDSHFIKIFHRHYGITPSAYRRKMRTPVMVGYEAE